MERFAIKIDKKLKANLYKICRLCGMDNPDMVPIILDKPADNENICIDVEAELEMKQKINILLGLSITKDDRMPQTMCCLCVDKINDFYEFREMCYATNAQTRKLLGLKNIKKPALDIKPKVEVKEESIVPTPIIEPAPAPASNKTNNKKRKSEEFALKEEIPDTAPASNKTNKKRKTEEIALKEETPDAAIALPKKKIRFAIPSESNVKEETPGQTKKKLRFSAMNDETTSSSSKKSKNNVVEDTKLKKEPSPPVTMPPPAVSNKKLRLAAPPQKESALKKSKQKGAKNSEQKDADVKEEIKEEVKEEPASVVAPSGKVSAVKAPSVLAKVPLVKAPTVVVKVPPAPKLKFGCNICKERFPAKVNLETHRTSHIPKVERYVCTACNEVLTKSFDIKNHQLWHKLSKTPYVCGCCGETILNTYAFSRHLREHTFETPPALLVLDRECPQCHTSYATNFLYNIHVCAVKTRRCAGCNRLQRNDAEYLKHSAQCAKVYLNYSKHIMPTVEALEDAVRIKNENDVEAAAEEMARISGVPLDMAPVVQLTRLSSPLIVAAAQCVSTTGLDDGASPSSKKSGKKGVSKKDLKRVDNLLKSTLDALVSIKHEPEVHVDQEAPAGEHSDNDDRHGTDDDDSHHNNQTVNEKEEVNRSANVGNINESNITTEGDPEQVKIKQEIDETNEEISNKISGGLKLKIKKEHGQLNSSIIEQQQKSSDKRAEKRKKKKKHKEKEKDKQKSKDAQDEPDLNTNNEHSEANIGTNAIRIKVEPQDVIEGEEKSTAQVLQARPQPEATIMTSIPMMQFQIACVSSGVEFNNVAVNPVVESHQVVPSANSDAEPEDVKPNRQELDRMLKISHVSSGIAMATDETEESKAQDVDHDCNYDKGSGGEDDNDDDYLDESNEDDQLGDDNGSDHEDDNRFKNPCEEQKEPDDEYENSEGKSAEGIGINNKEVTVTTKKIKKPLLQLKPQISSKSKEKSTITKSRNKACKSTAKPANIPILQISSVQSGVMLEPSTPTINDFTPIFIKPEPQNRGYSDEQEAVTIPPSHLQPDESVEQEENEDLAHTHTAEEQSYISTIDFNNITIKQEKDIEINDIQITQKSVKSFAKLNGIKRKRRQIVRPYSVKDKTLEQNESLENNDEYMNDEEEHETDEEYDEEMEEEEEEDEEDEGDEDEEEEDEEMDEEDEEREYRELEYPPELEQKKTEHEERDNEVINVNQNNKEEENYSNINEDIKETPGHIESNVSFVIANVCSQAFTGISEEKCSQISDDNVTHEQIPVIENNQISTSANDIEQDDLEITANPELECNKTLNPALADKNDVPLSNKSENESSDQNLSSVEVSPPNSDITLEITSTDIPNSTTNSLEIQTENTHLVSQTTIQPHEISIQAGEPTEIRTDSQTTEALNYCQEPLIAVSTTQAYQETQNPDDALSQVQYSGPEAQNQQFLDRVVSPEVQSIVQHGLQEADQNIEFIQESRRIASQENPQVTLEYSTADVPIYQEHKQDSKDEQQYNLQNTEPSPEIQFTSHALLEDLPYTPNSEVQPQTSTTIQPVFEISSVRTTACSVTPEVDNCLLRNNNERETSKDHQENTATIEGTVQQSKDVNLEALPVLENFNESINIDENENYNEDEDENDLEEVDNNDEDSTLDNSLEERQNYQNQEVLSQIRPTALALHPYLEDISSSSNSLLSNSLSQTPPPPMQLAAAATSVNEFNAQRLLNTEETENILNESNDVQNPYSLNVAQTSTVSVSQPQTQPILGQQLPPQMPTFNFDNINEIAENNNNANIEREQLQDEQHQHQHN